MLQAQEIVPLPLSLKHLIDKEDYFQQKVRDDIVKMWKFSYHYDEQYSRSILDSIEIICVPIFKIKARKNPHRDFTQLSEVLASLRPLKDYSYFFFFKNGQYFGGLQDTPFYTDSGISGDSLAHLKFGTLYEKAAMEIRRMNPLSLFSIQSQGGIWLILQDHSLIVYDTMFDRFYQPQEYLDRTPEELDEMVKTYLKGATK